MSVNLITYRDGAKIARPVTSEAEFRALRNDPKHLYYLSQARAGDDNAKRRLLQFNYSGHYPNQLLKGNKLISNAFALDIDNPAEFERIVKLLIASTPLPLPLSEGEGSGNLPLTQSAGGNSVVPPQASDDNKLTRSLPREGWGGALTPLGHELGLLMLERSVRQGGHVVFRREQGKTILENQVRVAMALGCEMDTNAHDVNRVYFATSGSPEDLPYLSPDLFADLYDEEAVLRESQLVEHREEYHMEVLPDGAHQGNKHYKPSRHTSPTPDPSTGEGSVYQPLTQFEQPSTAVQEEVPTGAGVVPTDCPDIQPTIVYTPLIPTGGGDKGVGASYLGIPYAQIIAKYWELFNNGKEPREGDRNVKTFELAMALRPICEYNAEKLMQVIPRYDGLPVEEWRRTIESALGEPRKGMPYRTQQVIKAMQMERCLASTGGTSNRPPQPPKRLPRVLRTLLCKVPDYWKPRYAPALFASLASHLHDVTFRHWDGVEHTATFESVFCGQQSSGKGRVNDMIDKIIADIVEADKPSRAREAEWKRKNPNGKTKAKDVRPADILIRVLSDNLTEAVFNQRIIDCDRNGKHFVYTRVDELESLKTLTTRRSVDEVSLLIRKAFDNAMAGQERVGPDSVNGLAPLRWNWNASTTPGLLRTFFKGHVANGTISRLDLNLLMIDCNDPDYSPPIVGIYDDAYAESIKPIIDNLNNASGLVECQPAKRLAVKLHKEYDKLADQMESEAFRVLSRRANVICYLRGMVLYIASGYKWDRDIEDYVRYSMQHDLYSKIVLFGDSLEEKIAEERSILKHSGPQNMLELLPDAFDDNDYQRVRASLGKEGDGATTLRVWVSRKYIVWDEIIGKYCKTPEYKVKH